VEVATDESKCGWAQLVGGPCDGRLDPLEPDTAGLQVIMSDSQQHVYRKLDRSSTDEWLSSSGGPVDNTASNTLPR
jgi:hypothetical protein